MGDSFLERVTAARRADADRRAAEGALESARAAAAVAGPARDLPGALARPGLSLIAEVKRASPSAGTIRDVDAAAQACAYEAGGATALSVLTEPEHFRGSLNDLRAARDATRIPALRKDFLCSPLHLWEARAAGADAVLLIVAALEQTELVGLMDLAETIGLAVLVEVHTEPELDRALAAGAGVVGINTRNLLTLEVDPGVVKQIRPLAPDGVVVVAESGVKTRADVEALEAIGVDAVLVGEALMRADDPSRKVRELLGKGE